MPRLTNATPKYRKHKASGQAIVTLCGKDHYLGPHGTKASKVEYDRLVAEWLSQGRPAHAIPAGDISIVELAASYWKFAVGYYRKNGKPTDTIAGIRGSIRWLKNLYGNTSAADFGPLALKSIQNQLIEAGQSRRYINDNIDRIRRMFRWAASEELIPGSIPQALSTVDGLRKGRTKARESTPILPVDEATIEATLPHLSPVVADMVRFQRLTGCRPGEVCILRPCDIDRTKKVWAYTPESHKTEHHGRERVIYIGPKGQEVLMPYLLRSADSYCFSPAESEAKRRERRHAARKTPIRYGNRPGSTSGTPQPKRSFGDCYTNDSYRRAIHRACDAVFPPPEALARRYGENFQEWRERLTAKLHEDLKAWRAQHRWSPNQLRHAAATEIRRRFGLEAAQVTLGHASADVSQIYAERDLQKAEAIMGEVG